MNPESHRKKRAAAAARRAPKRVAPAKRTVEGWEYFAILYAAGLLAWQLVQALWLGRVGDFIFEEEEYLYFYEHPVLFVIELVVFLAATYGVFLWGRSIVRALRK